ncbi:MAG: FeS assembly SUF system protein [Gammaproteobacteria bacterium SG8_15]|nr:MAG: FeS assembly SUF system protein [Gammaproteobacteria bacterium SG8_15]
MKTANEPVAFAAGTTLEEKVIEVLKTIYDPEIPVNIYDLGLIYEISTDSQGMVTISMTLTSPHCPVAESLPGQIECAIKAIDEVSAVVVKLVWDPPWDKERMSEEAKLILDMY